LINSEPEFSVEIVLKKMGNSTAPVMPPKRKYVLAEMITQCDLKPPMPADLALWEDAQPVGQEVQW
jgi:antitoxin component of MazEF toxin-antitoxin module